MGMKSADAASESDASGSVWIESAIWALLAGVAAAGAIFLIARNLLHRRVAGARRPLRTRCPGNSRGLRPWTLRGENRTFRFTFCRRGNSANPRKPRAKK